MNRESRERNGRRLTSVNWSTEVDQYLDHLVATVPDGHGRTSRTRLLSALVSTTPADPALLVERLVKFEKLELTELPAGSRATPRLGRPTAGQS